MPYKNMPAQNLTYPKLDELPVIFKSGFGPFLFDINDKKYIDFMNSKGSVMIGHNPDELVSCIEVFFQSKKDVRTGYTKSIFELSTTIKHALGYEDIAYFKTGTEGVKAAISCVIKYNKKKFILTCGYHGYDSIWDLPNKLGECNKNGIIDFFYDLELFEKLLQKHKNNISAVVISPDPLYFDRTWFDKFNTLICAHKILLIADEVKVGFRYCYGLYTSNLGLKPDIAIISKAIGNGFPISIVCGRNELLKYCADMTYTSFFDSLTFFVTNRVMGILKEENYYSKLNQVSIENINILDNLIKEYRLPIKIKSNCSIFQFILPDQNASDLFFKESIKQGIIFYPEDNQSISSAFESDELKNELINRFSNLCKTISTSSLFHKEKKPTLEWEIRTAWNLIDGFPNIKIPKKFKKELLKEIFLE